MSDIFSFLSFSVIYFPITTAFILTDTMFVVLLLELFQMVHLKIVRSYAEHTFDTDIRSCITYCSGIDNLDVIHLFSF